MSESDWEASQEFFTQKEDSEKEDSAKTSLDVHTCQLFDIPEDKCTSCTRVPVLLPAKRPSTCKELCTKGTQTLVTFPARESITLHSAHIFTGSLVDSHIGRPSGETKFRRN